MKSRDWTRWPIESRRRGEENHSGKAAGDGYEKRRRMKFSETDTRFLTLRFPLPMICKLPWPARFIAHPYEAWSPKEIHRSSTVKNRPPPRIASSYLSAPSNSLTLHYEPPFQRIFVACKTRHSPWLNSGFSLGILSVCCSVLFGNDYSLFVRKSITHTYLSYLWMFFWQSLWERRLKNRKIN